MIAGPTSKFQEAGLEILTSKKETKTLNVPPATASITKVKFTLHKGVEGEKGIEGDRYGIKKAGVDIHLASKGTKHAASCTSPSRARSDTEASDAHSHQLPEKTQDLYTAHISI